MFGVFHYLYECSVVRACILTVVASLQCHCAWSELKCWVCVKPPLLWLGLASSWQAHSEASV